MTLPRLDHAVVYTGSDLDAAQALYSRLGFRLTPRGFHTLGSINHLAIFGENYLELLGVPVDRKDSRPDLWKHPVGLSGLALNADDAKRLHETLTTGGKTLTPVRDFSRPVEVDGKQEQASFRTFQLVHDDLDGGRIFFCQHNTPELVWREEDRLHSNGVTDIVEFVIASSNVDVIDKTLAPLGQRSVDESSKKSWPTGRAEISVLTPGSAQARFGDNIVDLNGFITRLIALKFAVHSISQTGAFFENQGIVNETFENGLIVPAGQAYGVALIFAQSNQTI